MENTNCLLLWGTNPQASQPVLAKQISRARRRGAKLIVIDPRGHALAARADCWLRVRPGSDGALALAMIHVLLEERLYDEAFVRDWTNAPFLVREDSGQLLTSGDLSGSESANGFVVWDSTGNGPAVFHPERGYAQANVAPELSGQFECRLYDGSFVRCRPVLELFRQLAAAYAPERSANITWVAANDVRKAVRMFTRETPSAYTSWTGTEQHSSAMQINRAIGCFYALTGQFDQRGSNVLFMPTPNRPISGEELLPPEQRNRRLSLADHPLGPPNDPGIVQAKPVYDAIIDHRPYPVRAMVLFGSDMLLGHADPQRGRRALQALDFYVHIDMFENPSSRFADLLLPACTAWECETVRPYFPGTAKTMRWSQLRNAVIAPLYESRPDLDILFDLAMRLGLGEHFFNGDIEGAWNHHLEPSGLTVQQLREHPVGIGGEAEVRHQKYAVPNPNNGRPRGFPTPSGRIELYSASFARAGYAPLPEYVEPVESPLGKPNSDYPLVLTAFRSINYCDQQHRNIPRLRRGVPDPVVELNPETAAKLNIADGEWAIVETNLGRIKLKASYNNSLHPGVAAATYGWWQGCRELGLPGYDPLDPEGANVNLLIPDTNIDPISASVPHRSRMCRVTGAS
jgi:anaerobic selenocysteine-containing dehydrogenase